MLCLQALSPRPINRLRALCRLTRARIIRLDLRGPSSLPKTLPLCKRTNSEEVRGRREFEQAPARARKQLKLSRARTRAKKTRARLSFFGQNCNSPSERERERQSKKSLGCILPLETPRNETSNFELIKRRGL